MYTKSEWYGKYLLIPNLSITCCGLQPASVNATNWQSAFNSSQRITIQCNVCIVFFSCFLHSSTWIYLVSFYTFKIFIYQFLSLLLFSPSIITLVLPSPLFSTPLSRSVLVYSLLLMIRTVH